MRLSNRQNTNNKTKQKQRGREKEKERKRIHEIFYFLLFFDAGEAKEAVAEEEVPKKEVEAVNQSRARFNSRNLPLYVYIARIYVCMYVYGWSVLLYIFL